MIEILMIEDDKELAEILSEFLGQNNIKVTNFTSPTMGMEALKNNKYSLLLLDLTLPEMDGLEVCKKIVQNYDLPIIISSARNDTQDKVEALSSGAYDYLPKPYDPKELLARINNILKRHREFKSNKHSKSQFNIDKETMSIFFKDKRLDLTKAEYEILSLFLSRPGHIFSREEITNNCDSIKPSHEFKSVDVMVGRLRNKICKTHAKKHKYIASVRGFGYRLNID